jgi:hypothetical protein
LVGGSVWRRRCGRVAARAGGGSGGGGSVGGGAVPVPGVVPPSAVLGAAARSRSPAWGGGGPRGRIRGRDLRRARGRRGAGTLALRKALVTSSRMEKSLAGPASLTRISGCLAVMAGPPACIGGGGAIDGAVVAAAVAILA